MVAGHARHAVRTPQAPHTHTHTHTHTHVRHAMHSKLQPADEISSGNQHGEGTRHGIPDGGVGLEAPEEFWVTLDVYERDNGPADPASIVWEEVDGVRTAGVSWQSNLVLFQFRLNGLIN